MSSYLNKNVVVIAGPTGVGKTAVALQLAKHFNAEIISADSRQCFKELCIGVARPSIDELAEISHHFIASHSVHDEVNAIVFEKYALLKVDELFQKNNVVIMVGGTGLYIKAFCEGMDDIPVIDPKIRNTIGECYNAKGIEWLQQEIHDKDPGFYKTGDIKNPQRLMRALEVVESTGQSILYYRTGKKVKRNFNIIKIALASPKEQLHQNITARAALMISGGLIEEVTALQSARYLNALQTVGYSEIFDFLDHKITLQEAVALIIKNTKQYAKRQLTWFKKDNTFQWFCPRDVEKITEYLKDAFLL